MYFVKRLLELFLDNKSYKQSGGLRLEWKILRSSNLNLAFLGGGTLGREMYWKGIIIKICKYNINKNQE